MSIPLIAVFRGGYIGEAMIRCSVRFFSLCLHVAFFSTMQPLCAQPNWSGIGLPLDFNTVTCLYSDVAEGTLYVAGHTSPITFNGYTGSVVGKLTNNHWDTLGSFQNPAQSIIRWGDSLVFGGYFNMINGEPFSGIARWDGTAWQHFGEFQPEGIERLRALDGDLYAVGSFDYADGQFCNGVAKRVNGQWVPLGELTFATNSQVVQDIALYNGQLVICGAITAPGNIGRDIMVFNGSTWSKLMDEGFVGGFSGARSLIEYHGDLIVTGPIDHSSGNVGHSVQLWDGATWQSMGTGLTVSPNNYSWITGGYDMAIRDSLLYVAGGFWYADGIPAAGLATWNGSQWCGLGAGPSPTVRCLTWYNDTLYVGLDNVLDGVDVNCAAKYIGNYPDTCSAFSTTVSEVDLPAQFSLVYSEKSIVVCFPSATPANKVILMDALGRIIDEQRGREVRFDLRGMSSGCYIVQAAGYAPRRVLFE